LLVRGFKVTATDLSPDVVGQNLGGVTVCGAVENCKSIAAADLTIITGMTLSNGTLPSLLETAKTSNTSTMIWAVTGRNLGQYYTEHGAIRVGWRAQEAGRKATDHLKVRMGCSQPCTGATVCNLKTVALKAPRNTMRVREEDAQRPAAGHPG
jgi:hypothetical protein